MREDGSALLVIFFELDEVVAYSSRVVVMRDRQMVPELTGRDISPAVIGQATIAQAADRKQLPDKTEPLTGNNTGNLDAGLQLAAFPRLFLCGWAG